MTSTTPVTRDCRGTPDRDLLGRSDLWRGDCAPSFSEAVKRADPDYRREARPVTTRVHLHLRRVTGATVAVTGVARMAVLSWRHFGRSCRI